MKDKILVIDDDRATRRMIMAGLKTEFPHNIIECENGREASDILQQDKDQTVKLVILDWNMPIMNGEQTLAHIQKYHTPIPVIILTASKEMDDAINALKNGAVDFLNKPVNKTRLCTAARNALKLSTLSNEIIRLKNQQSGKTSFKNLIGHNGALKPSIALANKAAACDLPTMISGETGTGKEVFARAIHGESTRSSQNFIAVNCGAIPEKLVESTLFGHEKGAFTGAHQNALGKFREADGGTIFLDEIGELPLEAQVKLLRVLQQQEIEPVGAGKSIPINTRVISATNRDLETEVAEGRFREDLYFRLNVLQIHIPPLRKRKPDIPDLCAYFVEQFCTEHQIQPKHIDENALEKLTTYTWPGNIRQLENAINRAIAMSEKNTLEYADFSLPSAPTKPHTISRTQPDDTLALLDEMGNFKNYQTLETEILNAAIKYFENNMTQTARALGIAKSTLYAKTKETDAA